MRTKIASMLAVCFALTVGTIALTAGVASAHALITYDCNTVTVNFTQFATNPPQEITAVVNVNGVDHDFSWTTSDFTATVPFVSHAGDPDVVVKVTWQGLVEPGSAEQTFSTDDCASVPTTTTAPPTTTTIAVGPNDASRVAAAEAVVAAPVFTG